MHPEIPKLLSRNLSLKESQITSVINLLNDGGTVPFIARYRKEITGNLDELQIGQIQTELKRLNDLVKRRDAIIKSLKELDVLTDELESKINIVWEMTELEDIYLPYKPRRKTRASIAIENGLEDLANILMSQQSNYSDDEANRFIGENVADIESALAGAKDIIAEWVNEDLAARQRIRQLFIQQAIIKSKLIEKKRDEALKYQDYFDFEAPLKSIPSHRLLAIRRAENEGFLRVSISVEIEHAIVQLERIYLKAKNKAASHVSEAIRDSYKRLLSSAIETEFKNSSKEKADQEAIDVFSGNLRQLLMGAPLGERSILAIDPGFRSGCKVVCLDKQGSLLDFLTIYPHPPQTDILKSTRQIMELVKKHAIEVIAIGNGTAGRETERFIKLISAIEVDIFLVNEAGASIYSASELARSEFPDLDLTVRGAISIGRRLMDPLAELVKIDPKSIGVGQYQYDVNQEKLRERLEDVVISVVNNVGVNLNTASHELLRYVSGIGPKLADSIVNYRETIGKFKNRKEITKVSGLGAKAFEQCAGFLRITAGSNPLDASAVHPESYSIVEKMASDLAKPISDLISDAEIRKQIDLSKYLSKQVGMPTLTDILEELEKPGRDPRGEVERFEFADVKDITDLNEEMILPGIVTNLTKFGAFVDIGIKENGLLHISQIADRFIKDPAEVLKLDQKLKVKIITIDLDRKRIQLSLKF